MYFKLLFLVWLSCFIFKATSTSINFNGDIEFLLYTKNVQKYPQQLFLNDNITLNLSDFKSTRNTIFLIHEWGTGIRSIHLTPIKLTLLNTQDVNIIVINWHNEAILSYPIARKLVSAIGQYVGGFIQFLLTPTNSKLSRIYIISYGLGAHIAGNIGIKIKRITALNPQNELFSIKDTDKLSTKSAECVEIIYTTSKYYLHDLSKRNIFILNENTKSVNLGEYYAQLMFNQTVKAIKCNSSNCNNTCSITLGTLFSDECFDGYYYLQQ